MQEPEFRLVKYRNKFAVEFYHNGKRQRSSLRTDDREEARRELAIFKREWIAAQRRVVTVETAWNGYLAALGPKPAAVTMGHEWKSVGPHFGAMLADTITEEECNEYIAKRRAAGRSDGTIWTELGRLRSALRWAEKKDLIGKAPTIYRPQQPPPRDKRLSKAQARQFLEACEFPHLKLFVTLAIATGARSGALLGLKWNRVDLDAGMIHLADPDRPRTKKGRASVPINRTARKALEDARKGALTDYVIEWGGQRVGSVKKGLKSAGVRSGLPWVTPHVFRHSAATWMAEAGRPMGEIAQFLGHTNSTLTERVYARFSPGHLRKAAAALELDDDEC
jgi:integrase